MEIFGQVSFDMRLILHLGLQPFLQLIFPCNHRLTYNILGSQHWKKKPALKKNKDKQAAEKRKVMFDEGTGEKKERKKAAKKDRVFIDFTKAPE